MRYPHVLAAFAAEPWAMQPEKLRAIIGFLALKAAGGSLTAEEIQARVSDRRAAEVARSPAGAGVLPVYGVISQRVGMMQEISGGTSTEALGASFRSMLQDDRIGAIIFEYDSPGGSTYGIEELATEIREARGIKPMVAQVNSQCASAAYYLAAQADEIVVTPSGDVGSIGVYGVHEDVSKALAQAGVKPTLIRGEEMDDKAEGHPYFPLSADAKAHYQERVNLAEDQFIRAVAAGRKVSIATVKEKFGKGRSFDPQEAVRRGMADSVGTLRATLARFGAAPARPSAAAASRQAFAAGDTPALNQIEDVLREAGFPNALATAFVSRGKGALRSESGPEQTAPTITPEAQASLDRLLAKLSG